jgi:hypothetical protein
MRKHHLMSCGVPAAVAEALSGSTVTGISAAGTTVSDATQLTGDYNVVSTVAAAAGVVLPSNCTPGDWIEVLNTGANPLTVYAPSGGSINGHTADVGVVLMPKAVARFRFTSTVNVTCFFG